MSDMSSETVVSISPSRLSEAEPGRALVVWEWVEGKLVWMGDRLNPILVKEARQAIKSRQFSLTFVLILAAAWIITFAGVTLIGPSIYYAASGAGMFWAYYWILAFPLAVIVPYGAYRSLAAEREDNTYELLSISTITPRQIISGKLGSAFVQMLVYLSAVAPCLAFTYLLRGIDILTVAILLTYTVLGSLGLSVIGLMLAALAKQRYSQVLLSALFVVGLFGTFIGAISFAWFFLEEGYQVLGEEGFWIACVAVLTIYSTTFALVFFAAAAQITFTSDNRSTPLRIAMLVQQCAFLGWLGYGFIYAHSQGGPGSIPVGVFVVGGAMVCGIYWYVMGTMMTAESPILSRRVQRSLPQSYLGRLFLTWFNPGPGTGYVFAIANLESIVAMGLLAAVFLPLLSGGTWTGFVTWEELIYFLVIGFGYVTLYLGIGKFLIDLLRRFTAVPIVAAVLLQAFLVALGCMIPVIIQLMSYSSQYTGYSLLHALNPFWTLSEIVDGTMPADVDKLVFLIPGLALLVFVLNFRRIAIEVRRQRVALPVRVAEDEAAMRPPEVHQPQSPWDDGSEEK